MPTQYLSARRKSGLFNNDQRYLYGLRGILAIQSFLWLFFKIFDPALTVPGANEHTSHVPHSTLTGPIPGVIGGSSIVVKRNLSNIPQIRERSPEYQVLLRKVLEPLLWDESFIFSFFILLSARTVCISFLENVSTPAYARSLISRPIRIGIPLAVALAMSCAIFSTIDTTYLEQAAGVIGNPFLRAPEEPAGALAAFNSIWNLLWVTKDYSLQMGNLAWPSWTLWVPSAAYLQSYTVYILMVILPYTRPSWHIQGLFMFAFGSWWFNSWGWYSATGLFLADVSINPALRSSLMRGYQRKTEGVSLPYWFFAALFFVVGLGLKYMWTAALPGVYWKSETYAHPSKYVGSNGNFGYVDGTQPYPRMDNYLIIVGMLLGLEFFDFGKRVLASRIFQFIGNRSMSKSCKACQSRWMQTLM